MTVVPEAVRRYAEAHTTPPGPALNALAAETAEATPHPQMMSGPIEAGLLQALVVAGAPRRVLEIGTFTGHGALALAARLPDGGRVVTIERNERLAAIARRHIGASPARDRIELLVGDARELVPALPGPFDLVFVDAAKADYVAYFEALVPKLSRRGLIVADNVLWGGAVLDGAGDEQARALRDFADRVHADPRVDNVLLSAGDGLMLIWRRP